MKQLSNDHTTSESRLWNLFYDLCGEEAWSILDSHTQVFQFAANEKIFAEGEPVKGIYVISEGIVKVVTSLNRPEERILKIAGPGDLLGHRGLSSEFYPISAATLTQSKISFIPAGIFHNLIRGYPELSLYIIRFLAEELRNSEHHVTLMVKLEVLDRIAFLITEIFERFGYHPQDPTLPKFMLSRKDLANLAGTSYETVIRSLSALEKKKYIQLDKKTIRILNPEALRSMFYNQINTV